MYISIQVHAEEGGEKMVAHTSEREDRVVVRQTQEMEEENMRGQKNGETRTQNSSVETEMKEMVSHQRSPTGSKLSEDSFTTLSRSSSPEDSDVRTPIVEGEKKREGNGDEEEKSEELGESEEGPVAADSSSTRQSHDGTKTSHPLPATSVTAIATGSTHYPTSIQGISESPNSQQLSDMDTSLLHEALHDHSPHLTATVAATGRELSSAAHLEGRCTCSRGWGLDVDGMPSRCTEAEIRLLSILTNYEARINELKSRLAEAIAKANSVAALRGDVKSAESGGKIQGGETEEEEANKEENKEDSLVCCAVSKLLHVSS